MTHTARQPPAAGVLEGALWTSRLGSDNEQFGISSSC